MGPVEKNELSMYNSFARAFTRIRWPHLDRDFAQASVAEALRHLERSLERLVMSIAHERLDISVDGVGPDALARRAVADAYAAINLGADDQPNKSVVCLGVIGVGKDLVESAHQVNRAKAELRRVCAPLQTVRTRVPDPSGTGTKALPIIRVILRAIQRSDLNLLAAYRRIPILDSNPTRIVYTRAHTRSVYRKKIDDIAALLQTSDTPAAALDRERLRTLPASETHVALVRDRYENVRANVTFEPAPDEPPKRRLIAAELPIIYPLGIKVRRPTIKFPISTDPDSAARIRTRRSKLFDQPFLSTLSVYRYINKA